ncbi:phospholipid carrier-dependent glycosyltransferase [Actinomycetospora sp. TBRC 11914]|uniref:ArnT family glycosyltransferase n=1 Tax=Actinomycetospora sp. TBRC 11914 TaxID=2729387 RepID=UPI00145C41CB|nr:phospholipid carrier-dependent glycosyltransferase [Actinomycetospora sp. TBRC 11914]NMO92529.1 phospholipid carrier-dependent glycosyltransferase [Actinomycetospora sp. TBRC 11914]
MSDSSSSVARLVRRSAPQTTDDAPPTGRSDRTDAGSGLARRIGRVVPGSGGTGQWVYVVGAVALAALAVGLRAFHQTQAYELFMDEVQYADVANSFAAGRGAELFDEPFYLHPPLAFLYFSLFVTHPVDHMTVGAVLGLRPALLVFAFVNTLLVVAVTRRVVGRWASLVSGLVYALDAFVVRFDSRVMLEAPMMFCVLAGVLCLLVAVERETVPARRAFLVAGGVFFGLAVTTKSTSGLITAVPLMIMIVTAWGLRRREAAGVLGLQFGVYGVYVLIVLLRGDIGWWFDQTLAGTFRAVGLIKETGFTAHSNSPGFVSRILANLSLFASSYALIGVAVCYALYLLLIGWRTLRSPRTRRRGAHAAPAGGAHGRIRAGDPRVSADPAEATLSLVTCWLAGVLAAILYTGALGEVEEQTFYLLAVPSTVVIGLLVTQAGRWRAPWRVLVGVAVVALFAGSLAGWWQVHTTRDDAYARVIPQVFAQVDHSAQICLGEQTAQFVMPGFGVHKLTSLDVARRNDCRYAMVSTALSAQGLANSSTELNAELARDFPVVISAHGRTSGDLLVYDLDRPLPGSTTRAVAPDDRSLPLTGPA